MDKLTYYFIIGSFAGWLMEVFFKTISKEDIKRAGMGKGPFCMSYGLGLVIVYILVGYKFKSLAANFILCSIIGTTFEYITAIVLEKVYNLVLWEYSKLKFAINDHICLEFIFLWGVFGTIAIKIIFPFLDSMYDVLKVERVLPIVYSIAVFIITDYLVTGYKILKNQKNDEKEETVEKNKKNQKKKMKETL